MNGTLVAIIHRPSPDADTGEGSDGTGYLVGDHLVLTARHVVIPQGTERRSVGARDTCEVRFLGREQWLQAHVEWCDWERDVALVRVDATDCPAPESVILGRLDRSTSYACKALGFPKSTTAPDDVRRDLEGITGTIPAQTGIRGGALPVNVEGRHPSVAGWAGASGSALFVGEALVGVITHVPKDFRGGRLLAYPVADLADAWAQIPDAPSSPAMNLWPDATTGLSFDRARFLEEFPLRMARADKLGTDLDQVFVQPNTTIERRARFVWPRRALLDLVGSARGAGLVALLGEGGIGKSTLLRRLGSQLAERALRLPRHPVPLYVPLAGFSQGRLDSYIRHVLATGSAQERGAGRLEPDRMFKNVVVLLDGLDEGASADGVSARRLNEISAFAEHYPSTTIVLTSRPGDFPTRGLVCTRVYVSQLTIAQVRERLTASRLPPDVLTWTESVLKGTDKAAAAFSDLIRVPLFLTLLVDHLKNAPATDLPRSRASLLKDFVNRELTAAAAAARTPSAALGHAMQTLALEMSTTRGVGAAFTEADARAVLAGVGGDQARLLRAAARTTILRSSPDGQLIFSHTCLQDFLVAEAVRQMPNDARTTWLRRHFTRPWVEEALTFLAYSDIDLAPTLRGVLDEARAVLANVSRPLTAANGDSMQRTEHAVRLAARVLDAQGQSPEDTLVGQTADLLARLTETAAEQDTLRMARVLRAVRGPFLRKPALRAYAENALRSDDALVREEGFRALASEPDGQKSLRRQLNDAALRDGFKEAAAVFEAAARRDPALARTRRIIRGAVWRMRALMGAFTALLAASSLLLEPPDERFNICACVVLLTLAPRLMGTRTILNPVAAPSPYRGPIQEARATLGGLAVALGFGLVAGLHHLTFRDAETWPRTGRVICTLAVFGASAWIVTNGVIRLRPSRHVTVLSGLLLGAFLPALTFLPVGEGFPVRAFVALTTLFLSAGVLVTKTRAWRVLPHIRRFYREDRLRVLALGSLSLWTGATLLKVWATPFAIAVGLTLSVFLASLARRELTARRLAARREPLEVTEVGPLAALLRRNDLPITVRRSLLGRFANVQPPNDACLLFLASCVETLSFAARPAMVQAIDTLESRLAHSFATDDHQTVRRELGALQALREAVPPEQWRAVGVALLEKVTAWPDLDALVNDTNYRESAQLMQKVLASVAVGVQRGDRS